jgi:hypothetical protein
MRKKGWGFVFLTVSTFFVLDATLALMGPELAIEPLISLAATPVGMVVAYAAAYPCEKSSAVRRGGEWRGSCWGSCRFSGSC